MNTIITIWSICILIQVIDIAIQWKRFRIEMRDSQTKQIVDEIFKSFNAQLMKKRMKYPAIIIAVVSVVISSPILTLLDIKRWTRRIFKGKTDLEKLAEQEYEEYKNSQPKGHVSYVGFEPPPYGPYPDFNREPPSSYSNPPFEEHNKQGPASEDDVNSEKPIAEAMTSEEAIAQGYEYFCEDGDEVLRHLSDGLQEEDISEYNNKEYLLIDKKPSYYGISPEEIIEIIVDHAMNNTGDFMDDDGELADIVGEIGKQKPELFAAVSDALAEGFLKKKFFFPTNIRVIFKSQKNATTV
jgi:hypothetical protein